MFNSLSFRAMESSVQALAMQKEAIMHNLSNIETPGYKVKTVSFQDAFEEARASSRSGKYRFQAQVVEEDNTSERPDGNNVNLDEQNVQLVKTYIQTLALYQKIGGQITNTRYVINNAFK